MGRIAILGKEGEGKKNREKKAEWNWDKQKYVIRRVRKKTKEFFKILQQILTSQANSLFHPMTTLHPLVYVQQSRIFFSATLR